MANLGTFDRIIYTTLEHLEVFQQQAVTQEKQNIVVRTQLCKYISITKLLRTSVKA